MSAKQNAIGRARQRLSRAVDLSCNGRESEARAKTREAMELLDSELYADEEETEFEELAWKKLARSEESR